MDVLGRAGLVGITAAGMILGEVATARGDSIGFLIRAHNAGFVSSYGDGDLLIRGETVCREIARGNSAFAVTRQLWADSSLSPQGAAEFVAIAIDELCPQFWPEVESEMQQQRAEQVV